MDKMLNLRKEIGRYVESLRKEGYSEEEIKEILNIITIEARTGCHPDPTGDPGAKAMHM